MDVAFSAARIQSTAALQGVLAERQYGTGAADNEAAICLVQSGMLRLLRSALFLCRGHRITINCRYHAIVFS